MESLWSYIPQDVIMEILKYIDKVEDIKKFSLDSFIDDKFYKDENSIFWKFLFLRHLFNKRKYVRGVIDGQISLGKPKSVWMSQMDSLNLPHDLMNRMTTIHFTEEEIISLDEQIEILRLKKINMLLPFGYPI